MTDFISGSTHDIIEPHLEVDIMQQGAVKDVFVIAGPEGPPGTPGLNGEVTTADMNTAIAAASTADRARANHTGTQAQSTVVNLTTDLAAKLATADAPELIRDTMGAALVAGTNVTITPNDALDTITIAASSGGGGGVLASTQYNPASATTATQVGGTGTFSDVDATNLSVTFTVPASGAVIIGLSARVSSSSASNAAMWAVGVAGTVVAASASKLNEGGGAGTPVKTSHRFKITGLTPGASVTYRWMHANAAGNTTQTLYGGTGTAAHGPALMEVLAA